MFLENKLKSKLNLKIILRAGMLFDEIEFK